MFGEDLLATGDRQVTPLGLKPGCLVQRRPTRVGAALGAFVTPAVGLPLSVPTGSSAAFRLDFGTLRPVPAPATTF